MSPFDRSARLRLEALNKSLAIIEFRIDGTIVTANENFLRVMGYRLDEIVGRHHSLFVDPALRDSPEYRALWDSLKRGESRTEQIKRVVKDGHEVWLEATYTPIGEAGKPPIGVITAATDITHQKGGLVELQGKVAAISRSQAVIEFDLDGTVITANENFLRVMGYRLDEVVGQHHSLFVDPAFRASDDYRRFWERLRAGEYLAAQYRRIGKGGREVWLEATYNPILDADGRPVKVVKFATDITPRKEQNRALAHDFETSVKSMVEAVAASSGTVQGTAQALASAAEQTSQQSAIVATATEELGASVTEIARQMTQSTRVTDEAVAQAGKSESMVGELLGAADKIGAVTKLIADIASQTNLLALNATIEAARAGDAGKGFAVVAAEVKNLANQTARATDEIAQQVRGVQDSSQSSADAIRRIGAVISQVSEISASVSGAVEEQAAATREVSANIDGVQQAAAETGRSSAELLTLAETLAGQAKGLEQRVDEFLKKVYAM